MSLDNPNKPEKKKGLRNTLLAASLAAAAANSPDAAAQANSREKNVESAVFSRHVEKDTYSPNIRLPDLPGPGSDSSLSMDGEMPESRSKLRDLVDLKANAHDVRFRLLNDIGRLKNGQQLRATTDVLGDAFMAAALNVRDKKLSGLIQGSVRERAADMPGILQQNIETLFTSRLNPETMPLKITFQKFGGMITAGVTPGSAKEMKSDGKLNPGIAIMFRGQF